MKQTLRAFACFFLITGLASRWVVAGESPNRAAWMRSAHWGVETYFEAKTRSEVDGSPMTVERWNELVDRFDVEKLAAQLKAVGAGYCVITVGQDSGYYLAPNATYDRLVGIQPSKCARRDLVADLATALNRQGMRLLINLAARAPNREPAAVRALEWKSGPYRNREFQMKWESVIREWSNRWGTRVAGWWFESCNWPNSMYRQPDAPNFESFAAAARAGNPQAIVAFNPGVFHRALSLTPFEDYLSGEIHDPELWRAPQAIDGKMDGAQLHVLIDLGESHGKGPPRFTADQVAAFSRKVAKLGGALTWETPTQPDGTIAREFMDRLQVVSAAMAARE